MILLFSMSGFGFLVKILVHGFCILSILLFLYYIVSIKKGLAQKILFIVFVLILSLYFRLLFVKSSWIVENEKKYVGKYELTHYDGCLDCVLELKENNTYTIKSKDKILEEDDWEYFDDGDISYIEFDNGGHLGSGKYAYYSEF